MVADRFKGYLYMLDELDYKEPVLLDKPISLEEYASLVDKKQSLSERHKKWIVEDFRGDGVISFFVKDDIGKAREIIYLSDILEQHAGKKVKITVEVLD